jgi:hypothetical protein
MKERWLAVDLGAFAHNNSGEGHKELLEVSKFVGRKTLGKTSS